MNKAHPSPEQAKHRANQLAAEPAPMTVAKAVANHIT